uniref:BTB domain-containing protein n=1 Tax=Ditylenchus dipsaci TaxID=166011 RepID=A0A915DHF4_9BILA
MEFPLTFTLNFEVGPLKWNTQNNNIYPTDFTKPHFTSDGIFILDDGTKIFLVKWFWLYGLLSSKPYEFQEMLRFFTLPKEKSQIFHGKCEKYLIISFFLNWTSKLLAADMYRLTMLKYFLISSLSTPDDVLKSVVLFLMHEKDRSTGTIVLKVEPFRDFGHFLSELEPEIYRSPEHEVLGLSLSLSVCKTKMELRGSEKLELKVSKMISEQTYIIPVGIIAIKIMEYAKNNIYPTDFTKPHHTSDGVFILDGGIKIFFSKVVLALRSPVFQTMFYSGSFKEKEALEIPLPDVNMDEFQEMLRFLYPCNRKVTNDSWPYLLKLADRFQIDFISKKCEKEFLASVDCDELRIVC